MNDKPARILAGAIEKLASDGRKLVCEHPWQDILGPAYMELGSHGQRQWLGQYFTVRHEVAYLIVSLEVPFGAT